MSTEVVLDAVVPATESYEVEDLLDLLGRHKGYPVRHQHKRFRYSFAARNSLKEKFAFEFSVAGELSKAIHEFVINSTNVISYVCRGGCGSPGWLAYVLCGT